MQRELKSVKLSDVRPNTKRRIPMYEVFYNLKAEPFRLSPDHKFCYEHKGYAKARAYMAYAFKRAEGFVMITGRPGTGKTTLIGELVESLAGDKVRTANLVCTQLQADDLLKTVAFNFGISSRDYDKAELLQRLTTLFQRWHQEGGRALLIVDEAQDLSVSAMEELRLLTNIQIGGQPLVQIFLLGQPELRDLVMAPEMEQVHQRVIAASHLRGLEVDEAEAYVVHRLHAVGWKGDPAIDKAIFPLIHKFSEGVPRRINLICSRLFLLGSVEQRHKIEVVDVRDVIGELQAENLAAGSWFSETDFDLAREPEWLEVPEDVSVSGASADQAVDEPAVAQAAEPSEGDVQGSDAPVDADAKKKGGLEARELEAEEQEQGSLDVASVETEVEPADNPTFEQDLSSDDLLDAPVSPPATNAPIASSAEEAETPTTVDVIEELFEVVTSEEHVDAPEYFDEFNDESTEGYRSSGEGQERRYFSGSVIAESALASEEAVSELSSLPENYIADEADAPLPEFDSGESEISSDNADSDEDTSESDLSALQRDGKEWPLRSKPAESAAQSSGVARFAIAAVALVALVGASLFFVELYVSRQDQSVVPTAANPSSSSSPGDRGNVSVPLNPDIAEAVYEKPKTRLPAENTPLEQASLRVDGSDGLEVSDGVSVELIDAAAEPVAEGLATDGFESERVDGDKVEADAGGDLSVEAADADASGSDSLEKSIVKDSDADVELGAIDVNSSGDVAKVEIAAVTPQAQVIIPDSGSLRESSPTQPVVKQVFVVNFDFDSAALGQDANAVLSRAVSKLQEFPGSKATIAKNADGQTPGASAATMAQARAGAVQRFFVSEGVEPARISIESMDSQKLAAALPGQDFQRTIQVTVSRTLDG